MLSEETGQESVMDVCVHRIIHAKKRNGTRNGEQVASGERPGMTWKGQNKMGGNEIQKT